MTTNFITLVNPRTDLIHPRNTRTIFVFNPKK